jgi:hypothetical protein
VRRTSFAPAVLLLLTSGAAVTAAVPASAAPAPSCGAAVVVSGTATVTCAYTGAAGAFTVPAGVSHVTVDVRGAEGAATDAGIAGLGGEVTGTLSTVPGSTLQVQVGGAATGATGGYGGGGSSSGTGGGGGGASSLTGPSGPLVVAGGGGGGGALGSFGSDGGDGGGDSGADGAFQGLTVADGTGGTQTAGGATGGAAGQGGDGVGGAGGGGWFGGGGSVEGGGGGGAGYVAGSVSGSVLTTGGQSGNGVITLTYGVSSTALTASPTSSTSGQAVTLTATVTGPGNPATGTVGFSAAAGTLSGCSARPVGAGGIATCTTTNLPVGSGVVTAAYSGDANDTPSSATTAYQVSSASTAAAARTIVLTPATGTVQAGSLTPLTALVTDAGGSPVAGAQVVFDASGPGTLRDGASQTLVTGADGKAVVTLTSAGSAAGDEVVSATIDPSQASACSTSGGTCAATGTYAFAAAPVPTLKASAGTILAGQTATLTVRGTPGSGYDVLAANRPSSTFLLAHRGLIGADGTSTFSIHPLNNVNFVARNASGTSAQAIVSVHTALSLAISRSGHVLTFTGQIYPNNRAQAVYVYTGTTRVGRATRDASGKNWVLRHDFTASAGKALVLCSYTASDTQNANGHSRNVRAVL